MTITKLVQVYVCTAMRGLVLSEEMPTCRFQSVLGLCLLALLAEAVTAQPDAGEAYKYPVSGRGNVPTARAAVLS